MYFQNSSNTNWEEQRITYRCDTRETEEVKTRLKIVGRIIVHDLVLSAVCMSTRFTETPDFWLLLMWSQASGRAAEERERALLSGETCSLTWPGLYRKIPGSVEGDQVLPVKLY